MPKDAWRADDRGRNDQAIYIGRAEHSGGVFPGTLYPDLGVAHIPWGGQNYEKSDYQVCILFDLRFC